MTLDFPSRPLPDASEVKTLTKQLGLPKEDIVQLWQHNYQDWVTIRENFEKLDRTIPAQTSTKTKTRLSRQFTQIVLSGGIRLLQSLDVSTPEIRHVGIPLFARGDTVRPIGTDGIIDDRKDFPKDIVGARVEQLLSSILAVKDYGHRKKAQEPAQP